MPSTRQALPRWLRPANRLVRLLTRLGLRLGTIHVLTVPGRRSGVPRSTPVSPLTVDGKRYVVAGMEEADWVKKCAGGRVGHPSQGSERGAGGPRRVAGRGA